MVLWGRLRKFGGRTLRRIFPSGSPGAVMVLQPILCWMSSAPGGSLEHFSPDQSPVSLGWGLSCFTGFGMGWMDIVNAGGVCQLSEALTPHSHTLQLPPHTAGNPLRKLVKIK